MPKRKKQDNNDAEETTNTVTVKCALRKRCLNEDVYKAIQEDVTMMSSLAVEASRYIHFMLSLYFYNDIFDINEIFPLSEQQQRQRANRAAKRAQLGQPPKQEKQINFGYYFYSLLPKYAHRIDQVYRELRGDLPLYDNSHRSNILIHLVTTYETVFRTNIVTHAWKRLRKFFLKFTYTNDNGEEVHYKTADIRSTMEYLFYRVTDSVPQEALLQLLETHLQWNRQNRLFDINDGEQYFKHIELFYRLQRFNETNRHKNFKLIPQFKFGAIHIRYDTQGMFDLLKKKNLLKPPDVSDEKKKANPKWWRDHIQQNADEKKKMWFQFFKPPETRNKKFNFSLQTDGVAVSFSMHKPNEKPLEWSKDGKALGM